MVPGSVKVNGEYNFFLFVKTITIMINYFHFILMSFILNIMYL